MDYSSQHGLSCFAGKKMMIFLHVLLLLGNSVVHATATLAENESGNQSNTTVKSEISKREDSVAQRREHSFNADGTVNYHGSGSGHDSGDLVPPPGGGFNSPSIELSVGHTGASGPALSNSYGLPIPDDTYGPPKNFFSKPSSFRGPSSQYGPPNNNKYLPPPKPVYGPPKPQYRPPSSSNVVFDTSGLSNFRPPKPIRTKPTFSSRPKPVYGPPKDGFGSGFSQGTLLSPVTNIKSQYGPPKISSNYGTPLQPSTSYGPPKHHKHGHISAPPTPPVVKYDGWTPIPGLVSSSPNSFYGAPDAGGHGFSSGFDFSSSAQISGSGFDNIAPPRPTYGVPKPSSSSFGGSGFGGFSHGGGRPSKPSLSYGTPLQPSSSYGPPKTSSKLNFLSAVKAPSSSYGLPEPSLAPTPPKPSFSYGPPKAPSVSYGPPSFSFGPPKAPSSSYGPPSFSLSSFSSVSGSGGSFGHSKNPGGSFGFPKPPSSSYGPPRAPSSSYGPPKAPSISYGPPKAPSISYGPPKAPSSSYGPPKPPSSSYGPPKIPSSSYGLPTAPSSSYGPPKAPSSAYGPPTAPSSFFIPPRPPSSSYGPPRAPSSAYGAPQVFTTYSIPKPSLSVGSFNTAYRGSSVSHPLQPPSTYGAPSFQGGLYKTPLPPNALYGVPTAPAISGSGCCGSGSVGSSWQFPSDTYGAPIHSPPLDLHAPAVQNVPSIDLSSQLLPTGPGPVFSSTGPSTSYGTPLLPSTSSSVHHSPSTTYGVPTALPLRQPKNPVKFRPPVPAGLISSIGAKWGDSGAWGGNAHAHKFHGDTYIPPAVPDPDPGIQANKGNALVIPPPTVPSISYGQPSGGHDQFGSTAASYSSGEGNLYPPPPPPVVSHDQSAYDIQQSASVELPSSNNLDQGNNGHFSSGTTAYNAQTDSSHHPTAPGQDFSGVQNIPIKGTQGSYTLQIQAAGGNSGEHIPHGEVLSNGLLQDILAAIENPSNSEQLKQYNTAEQSSDPVASEIGLNILKQLGGSGQQSNSIQVPTQYGSDLSHASSNNVPLYSKNNEVTPYNSQSNETDVKIGNYLSQNKIALYYNNQDNIEERKGNERDTLLVQMLLPNNTTDSKPEGSDFGAFVSVKLQNAQAVTEVTSNSTRDDGS